MDAALVLDITKLFKQIFSLFFPSLVLIVTAERTVTGNCREGRNVSKSLKLPLDKFCTHRPSLPPMKFFCEFCYFFFPKKGYWILRALLCDFFFFFFFPKKVIGSYESSGNVSSAFVKAYQPRFLSGIITGKDKRETHVQRLEFQILERVRLHFLSWVANLI